MVKDLTKGPPLKIITLLSLPMIGGNLCQQLYNIVDSIVVGRFIGADALAAVGTAFALMVFLTSILLGLSMGSGVVFSQLFGAKNKAKLAESINLSFILIGLCALVITVITLCFTDFFIRLMQVPESIHGILKTYLRIIFWGTPFVFLYNWSASLLRALGNSKLPLFFLIVGAITNIILDLLFVLGFKMGVSGAALATIIAQAISGSLCFVYYLKLLPSLRLNLKTLKLDTALLRQIAVYSGLTALQQSIMNFGILMIQGLVNSFGVPVMAAFAAAVKIDAFAYMPVQDFGNAFGTYIAQNYGAGRKERIHQGIRSSLALIVCFCAVVTLLVVVFANQLMMIFIDPAETVIIAIGSRYLRIEGMFYVLIGFLFLFYGLYRGLGKIKISILLTVISLGTRVFLAYSLAPVVGLTAIWAAIPIGWFLADLTGFGLYHHYQTTKKL